MKRIFIIVFAFMVFSPFYAQNFFQRISVDLWDGVSMPLSNTNGCSIKPMMSYGLAFDYYFNDPHWSSGIFVQNDNARRKYGEDSPIHYRTLAFGLSGTYFFSDSKKISPFFTMRIGVAYNHISEYGDVVHHEWNPAIIPNCGIEICGWLRLAAYCNISGKNYNTAGLSFGMRFGGNRFSIKQGSNTR